MAAEIRDLEDQLYEYDHEYKLLEQELEGLRRQNQSLRRSAVMAPQPSILEGSKRPAAEADELPAPTIREQSSSRQGPIPSFSLPSTTGEGTRARESSSRSSGGAEPLPEGMPDALPVPGEADEFDGIDVDQLSIPTIISSSKSPPQLQMRDPELAPEDDLETSLSQIELPAQLASISSPGGAAIIPAAQVVSDKRVVELSFNPTLTRAVSFDDDEQDDGLFLVLQPKNAQGQFVPAAAALTVEILDPARDEEDARIGHRHYSESEIRGKIQPIGTQQGIHLTLPWNGPNPKADRVAVFVTYTFENGRQVVAHREIYVHGPNTLKTVWAPRAAKSSTLARSQGNFEVQTAGGSHSADSSVSPAQAAGSFPSAESAPRP
jgi:hypothetical protein